MGVCLGHGLDAQSGGAGGGEKVSRQSVTPTQNSDAVHPEIEDGPEGKRCKPYPAMRL